VNSRHLGFLEFITLSSQFRGSCALFGFSLLAVQPGNSLYAGSILGFTFSVFFFSVTTELYFLLINAQTALFHMIFILCSVLCLIPLTSSWLGAQISLTENSKVLHLIENFRYVLDMNKLD
jgi:hypothetical protein